MKCCGRSMVHANPDSRSRASARECPPRERIERAIRTGHRRFDDVLHAGFRCHVDCTCNSAPVVPVAPKREHDFPLLSNRQTADGLVERSNSRSPIASYATRSPRRACGQVVLRQPPMSFLTATKSFRSMRRDEHPCAARDCVSKDTVLLVKRFRREDRRRSGI